MLIISSLSLLCFLTIFYSRNQLTGLDLSVNAWAANINTDTFTQAAKIFSYIFDTTILLAATFPIVVLLLYKKQASTALLLVSSMGINAILLQIFKTFIVSPRPSNGFIFESSNSFPSGHLTSTIVFLGILMYLVWKSHVSRGVKIGLSALTCILVLLVGFNRIYLNVHWLTDVIAAPFLALFILSASIMLVKILTSIYRKKLRQTANLNYSQLSKAALCLRAGTLNGRAITNSRYSNK